MPVAAIGVANKSRTTYPSGITAGLELGFLSVGHTPLNYTLANPPGYAYSKGLIRSPSFGLHIGAAKLGYPGSFILGGYDRGACIHSSYT